MNRCLSMINVRPPPCLRGAACPCISNPTPPPPPLYIKLILLKLRALSLSVSNFFLLPSRNINFLHIVAEIRQSAAFPEWKLCLLLMQWTWRTLYTVWFVPHAALGFKWKSPCTVMWQDYRRQGCVLKGSVIQRNKQNTHTHTSLSLCNLNNTFAVEISVRVTSTGPNWNRFDKFFFILTCRRWIDENVSDLSCQSLVCPHLLFPTVNYNYMHVWKVEETVTHVLLHYYTIPLTAAVLPPNSTFRLWLTRKN